MPERTITPETTAANGPCTTDNGQPQTGPTGPRTPEGKARSSLNALKLGLSIQRHVILPFEDPAEYETLRATIHQIYEPQSLRETLAIDDVAQCRWAFRRFDEAERLQLDKATRGYTDNPHEPYTYGQTLGMLAEPRKFEPGRYDPALDQKPRPTIDPPLWPSLDNLYRYRTWWERKHARALTEFDRARQDRRRETADHQRTEWHDARMESHKARMEWHETRMAAAARREQRDQQRHQHNEANERRREEWHKDRIARANVGIFHLGKLLNESVSQNPPQQVKLDFPSHLSNAPKQALRR